MPWRVIHPLVTTGPRSGICAPERSSRPKTPQVPPTRRRGATPAQAWGVPPRSVGRGSPSVASVPGGPEHRRLSRADSAAPGARGPRSRLGSQQGPDGLADRAAGHAPVDGEGLHKDQAAASGFVLARLALSRPGRGTVGDLDPDRVRSRALQRQAAVTGFLRVAEARIPNRVGDQLASDQLGVRGEVLGKALALHRGPCCPACQGRALGQADEADVIAGTPGPVSVQLGDGGG